MIPLIIKGCLLPHLVNTKEPPAERGLHEGNRWAKRGAQCCRIDWRWHRHRVAMATPRPPPPSRQQEIAHERYFRKAIKRRKKKFCFLLSSYFRRTYKRCFQEPGGWRLLPQGEKSAWPALWRLEMNVGFWFSFWNVYCKLYGTSTKNPHTDFLVFLFCFFFFVIFLIR